MRFSRLTLAIVVTLFGAPIRADECWICDDVVELNDEYADCYLANYDLLMESFEAEGLERHQVNLAGCASVEGTQGTRGGLLQMGGLRADSVTATKSIYTLSREFAVCLKVLIEKNEDPMDPSVVFRLTEQCPNE